MGHMGSCKGQMGTALGQAQDKTKTEKGPHRGKVQFYRFFKIHSVAPYCPEVGMCLHIHTFFNKDKLSILDRSHH